MTSETDDEMDGILRDTIEEFGCVAGTLHGTEGDRLILTAHQGIPESVLARIETIPIGKGMAGLAAKRMEPVQVCNLQTDESDVVESGAKETGMEGSIAVPIIDADDGLAGVIGIAKPNPYEFTQTECERLLQRGNQIAERL